MNGPAGRERWAAIGSVVSAAAASACCWLPLLLVGLGASAAGVGVSATFERYRPFFLIFATVLLGMGFFLNYGRRERCAPGGACAPAAPRLRGSNRAVLWIATGLVVAFGLFPSYVGVLVGAPEPPEAPAGGARVVELSVAGMTCVGCETQVEGALLGVPGVVSAGASYEAGTARAELDPTVDLPAGALLAAVERAGYRASLAGGGEGSSSQSGAMTTVPVGEGPDGLVLIQEERLALVANVEDTTLSVVDLDARRVRTTIPVGRSPWGMARLGGSGQVVVSVHGARSLALIDEQTLGVTRTIPLPFRPTGIAVARDGSVLYVAGDDHKLHAIDLRTGEERRSTAVGQDPDGVALTAGGSAVWVTSTSGSISVIDLAADWSETRIQNPGKPEQIASHPARPLMFVSNYTKNALFIYRTDTLELQNAILGGEQGFEGPEEVRFAPDGSLFFLAGFESANVTCFDSETWRPCGQWQVGGGTIGVELAGDRLVTTNYRDNTISIAPFEPNASLTEELK